jgi:magnesium transporter
MLTGYPAPGHQEASPAAPQVLWLDLLNPSDEERASIEGRHGLTLPSRHDLSEVESSSRVSEENGVLFLSMPIVSPARALDQAPSPVGFVLSKDFLVTIRYAPLRSFDTVAAKFSKNDAPGTSVETFAALVDEMVDLSADLLEEIGADLDTVSRSVFPRVHKNRRHLTQSNDALRDVLIDVGNAGERLSRIRDSLLGLQRIVPFAAGIERDWIPPKIQARLKTAQTDLLSLTDYETHLSGKVQFLLDAVLGFINTKQNEIFTILTIVSVVGIPPTLVAGIYGMNFKAMPELDWAWGYQYGLALIALSTIVPLLWFKWRGWL